MSTATLTAPAPIEKKPKSYVRMLRIRITEEQAKYWDELTREEVDQISAPFQDDAVDAFNGLLKEKAARIVAQNELLASIPEDVKAKAQKLGLVLNLTAR